MIRVSAIRSGASDRGTKRGERGAPGAPWIRRLPLLVTGVATLLASTAAPAFAQAGEGGETVANEGALFLLLPIGAEGVGMARAMTALTGPEAVWWNPAGIARAEEHSFLLFRSSDLSGEGTAASFLLRREGLGSAAVSYLLFDLGDVELRDDQGNFLGTVSFRNHLGILSSATTLFDALDLGVNLKLIQSRISCRGQCDDAGVTATTWAVDAGAQWTLFRHLVLAGTVAHLGPDLQVVDEGQADPLPSRLRLAAAYELLHHWIDREELGARLVVEVEDRLRDPGSPARYIGAEVEAGLQPGPILSLRSGYAFGSELQVDGAGVGVGLRFERFDLGVSKSLTSTSLSGESEPVQITFGFIF